MATNTINTRIKLRTATLTEWTNNPQSVKIYKGEAALGLDTTNNKYIIKIGTSDSGSWWKDLSEDLTIPAGNVTGLGDNDYRLNFENDTENNCFKIKLETKKHGSSDSWTAISDYVASIKTTSVSGSAYDPSTNPFALKDYVDQAVSDASTQYYEGVRGSGETDQQVIARVTSGITVKSGSTFVIKTAIDGANKYEYVAFTYGTVSGVAGWNPMDGNYNAKNSYVDTAITDGKSTPTTVITAGTNLYTALQNCINYTKSEIEALDVSDSAVSGQLVSAVSETDGKISVTRRALATNDLPSVPVTKLALGANGEKIASNLLPSFVDDVIEGKKISGFFFDKDIDIVDQYAGYIFPESILQTNGPDSLDNDLHNLFDESDTDYYIIVYQYTGEGQDHDLHAIEVEVQEGNPSITGPVPEFIPQESGKIYVDVDNNKTYRWSGSQFVEISESLALGETSSTAYRGDRGKTAYDHATDSSRLTTAQSSKLYKIAITAQGHVASVTEAQASDIPGLSDKISKVPDAALNALAMFDPEGNIVDSGLDSGGVADVVTNFDGKVDKNPNAEQNNIAAFDDEGGATVDTGVSKAVLQSAGSRSNDSDLGLISKAQLAKVTGDANTSGTIAKAQATADSKVKFLGTTTTNIVSNPNVSTISIGGNNVPANIGDVAIYSNTEYRYTSNGWKTVQNAEIGAQVNVIESVKVGGDDASHPQKTFTITNKVASMSAADMRAALNVADGAQVNVVEGAKDADGNSFTITGKNIMITDLVLNGGSATTEVSMT